MATKQVYSKREIIKIGSELRFSGCPPELRKLNKDLIPSEYKKEIRPNETDSRPQKYYQKNMSQQRRKFNANSSIEETKEFDPPRKAPENTWDMAAGNLLSEIPTSKKSLTERELFEMERREFLQSRKIPQQVVYTSDKTDSIFSTLSPSAISDRAVEGEELSWLSEVLHDDPIRFAVGKQESELVDPLFLQFLDPHQKQASPTERSKPASQSRLQSFLRKSSSPVSEQQTCIVDQWSSSPKSPVESSIDKDVTVPNPVFTASVQPTLSFGKKIEITSLFSAAKKVSGGKIEFSDSGIDVEESVVRHEDVLKQLVTQAKSPSRLNSSPELLLDTSEKEGIQGKQPGFVFHHKIPVRVSNSSGSEKKKTPVMSVSSKMKLLSINHSQQAIDKSNSHARDSGANLPPSYGSPKQYMQRINLSKLFAASAGEKVDKSQGSENSIKVINLSQLEIN